MFRCTFGLTAALVAQFGGIGHASADFILGTPTNLGPDVNSGFSEWDPSISPDGLSLYYSTGKSWQGGNSEADLVVSTRAHLEAPWSPPERVGPALATSFDENQPELSSDGLLMYFSEGAHPDVDHQMVIRPGGEGRPDLWMSRRDTVDSPWQEPENLGDAVNSRYHDSAPSITSDGGLLVFGSTRPGGLGGSDIWLSSWHSETHSWSTPENLGSLVNSSGHDIHPEISADGRSLFFVSNRPGNGFAETNIWVTSRDTDASPWGTPVRLDSPVNTSETEWGPSLSQDGSMLFFGRWERAADEHYGQDDIWQVPLLALDRIPIDGSGDTYWQDFDEALGADSSAIGRQLPVGWTGSDNGIIHENATTKSFPAASSLGRGTPIYNAGADQAADRTLAIGVTRNSPGGILQLLADVTDADATSLQLKFDVEVWDAARSGADLPGEAAFDVTVEADTGGGFAEVVAFETLTTGATLLPPARDYLDGNAAPNRVSFDSNLQQVDIPAGSQLRVRWRASTDAKTTGWVYGLDNVQLSLSGVHTIALQAGDADQDLDFDQFDLVRVQQTAKYLTGELATWGEGDWNGGPGGNQGSPPAGDGLFNQLDIVVAQQAAKYLAGPYAAVEPGGEEGDGQASIGYDARTGEVWIDAPSGKELTSVNITSALGIFTGDAAQGLGGSFDNDSDDNIFKATFGSSFGSVSFGNVARTGLLQQQVLDDVTVIGSLAGGGDLGDVDLIYVPVPEPSAIVLIGLGMLSLCACPWRKPPQ